MRSTTDTIRMLAETHGRPATIEDYKLLFARVALVDPAGYKLLLVGCCWTLALGWDEPYERERPQQGLWLQAIEQILASTVPA